MKLFYVTLNTQTEAEKISHLLLEKRLAVCTNWFPMQCAYRWAGKIKQEPEVALFIKTQANRRAAIEAIIKSVISYTNCIAELDVKSVNTNFSAWLEKEVLD